MESNRQAGRELDDLIATKVMGWKLSIDHAEDGGYTWFDADGEETYCREDFRPSTTWEGMRLVVEEMKRRGWATEMNIDLNNYVVMRRIIGNTDTEFCSGGDLPHLVCLAALKALEADTHE